MEDGTSNGIPSQKDSLEVPEILRAADNGASSVDIERLDGPMNIVELVDMGLLTEEDLAKIDTGLDEELLDKISRRYLNLVSVMENLNRQQEMLRQQLALLAIRNQELEAVNEQLEKDVMTDPLTGLGSRRALDMRRDELVSRLSGEGRRASDDDIVAVVVMSIDVVNLKAANAVSQLEGDKLIVSVAKAMTSCLREGDVFRRGGDEFIGLFPVRNDQDFDVICEKMSELAGCETGKRMRIGYFVSYANGNHSLREAEDLADPKVHIENRIVTRDSYRP